MAANFRPQSQSIGVAIDITIVVLGQMRDEGLQMHH